MQLLEDTKKYRAESENECAKIIEAVKAEGREKGYSVIKEKKEYKTKKSKGVVIADGWLLQLTLSYGGFWDGIEQ